MPYREFHAKSSRLKLLLFFFPFFDGHKKWLTPIFRLKKKSGSNGRNDRYSTEGWYRFLWNLQYKFYDLKKFETNFIMFKALLKVAQPKQNKNTIIIIIIIIIKGRTGSRKSSFQ